MQGCPKSFYYLNPPPNSTVHPLPLPVCIITLSTPNACPWAHPWTHTSLSLAYIGCQSRSVGHCFLWSCSVGRNQEQSFSALNIQSWGRRKKALPVLLSHLRRRWGPGPKSDGFSSGIPIPESVLEMHPLLYPFLQFGVLVDPCPLLNLFCHWPESLPFATAATFELCIWHKQPTYWFETEISWSMSHDALGTIRRSPGHCGHLLPPPSNRTTKRPYKHNSMDRGPLHHFCALEKALHLPWVSYRFL